jgi:hypothetical protein
MVCSRMFLQGLFPVALQPIGAECYAERRQGTVMVTYPPADRLLALHWHNTDRRESVFLGFDSSFCIVISVAAVICHASS